MTVRMSGGNHPRRFNLSKNASDYLYVKLDYFTRKRCLSCGTRLKLSTTLYHSHYKVRPGAMLYAERVGSREYICMSCHHNLRGNKRRRQSFCFTCMEKFTSRNKLFKHLSQNPNHIK